MKKTTPSIFLVAFLLASFSPAAAADPASGGRTALRLYGGLNTMSGGDFNRGLCGWLDLWAHAGSSWGVDTDVAGSPGGWGTVLGADVLFPLTSWLSFGMGAGRVTARDVCRSSAEGSGGAVPDEQSIEMSLESLPVRAGFFAHIPFSERLEICLHAGAVYHYLARTQAVYRRDWESYTEEDRFDLKSSGLGYDGGLGLELSLGRHVSVFLDGQFRWAKFSKLFGTLDRTSSEGGEESREGTLYLFDYSLGDDEIFTLVDILSQAPSGPAFPRAAEAVADFGGFSLVVGVLLKL
ncbi:MAG: hypothetical protein A2Y56_15790 [Candidatus Aminicenantes bacterium RBG_13_63_10]|nr:MAG: hypothetical protein A2Y56_15790 [Candidatus Aminicenantes bacterium RBG_13_63_10]